MFIGFSDKLEQKANEKARKRGIKDMGRLFSYLEGCDVEGLDDVLVEIKDLKESGLYVGLMDAFRKENNVYRDRVFTVDELLQVRVLGLADVYLRHGNLIDNVILRSFLTAKHFLSIYSFIEFTYCVFTKKPTNFDDAINIFFSRLDERLILALDCFDEVSLEELPEPNAEYFKALKKLKWKNKNTKELYDKLTEFMGEIRDYVRDYPNLTERAGWMTTYGVTEDFFILTLAACNAVNKGRLKVEAKDIIIAYKTFFKLIKTDVTQYKAIHELVQDIRGYNGSVGDNGYLVCKECGGYYKLEIDESPDDPQNRRFWDPGNSVSEGFSDTCDCGGKLEYKKEL